MRGIALVLAFVAAVPPLLAAALILHFGVDVPAYDEWLFLEYFEKLSQRELALADLVAAHNEHRIVFPKLLYLAIGHLTRWDVRFAMLATLLLAGCAALGIHFLGRVTLPADPVARGLAFCGASLLVFGPVHCETWLWGIQMAVLFPIACTAGALAVAVSRLARGLKVTLCAGLATIATFSFGNGLLCWVVVLPLIALREPGQGRRPDLRALAAWLGGFGVTAGLYLHGATPSLAAGAAWRSPARAAGDFLAFLGTPLAFGTPAPRPTAVFVGAAVLVATASCAAYAVTRRRDATLMRRILPWVLLSAFSMASGLLTVLARMSLEYPPVWRYSVTSMPSLVAVVYLVSIVLTDARGRWGRPAEMRTLEWLAAALALGFLGLHAATSVTAVGHSRRAREGRLAGKAALSFVDLFEDDSLHMVFFESGGARTAARRLDRLGYLRPRLMGPEDVERLEAGSAKPCGVLARVSRVRASGWALSPGRSAAAHVVVLAFRADGRKTTPFAIAPVGRAAACDAPPEGRRACWTESFSGSIPRRATGVRGWGFDTDSGRACPLDAGGTPGGTSRGAWSPLPPGRPIDTIGLFEAGVASANTFRLRHSNTRGRADTTLNLGHAGDLPITGDWNGDGRASVGVYRGGAAAFYLLSTLLPNAPTTRVPHGPANALPVAGDWDGDGLATVGVYVPAQRTFLLRNSHAAGTPDLVVPYGAEGDLPIVGDWDGDGVTTIGVYRPSEHTFYLRNSNTPGFGEVMIPYGIDKDLPIAGDFYGTGADTVGVYRPSDHSFHLRHPEGQGDILVRFGQRSGLPLVGNWNGT